MKEIVFILSSLNDPHYQKRVEAFIDAGYNVTVYGYKRKSRAIQELPYKYTILGEIENGNYISRLKLFFNTIKGISKQNKNKICFYSSMDIAIFATRLIKSPYIYEVCDLTELCIDNKAMRNVLIRENKRIISHSIYPIGILKEDIVIHFLHYKTFEDAKNKWFIRIGRIDWDRIFYVFVQQEGCTNTHISEFSNLTYDNKVILTNRKEPLIDSESNIPGFDKNDTLGIITNYVGWFGKRYYDYFDWRDFLKI